jgi:hypothetical protein
MRNPLFSIVLRQRSVAPLCIEDGTEIVPAPLLMPSCARCYLSARYNQNRCSYYKPGGNNVKSFRCASRTSCGTYPGAVSSGEVGSRDISHRITERLRFIPKNKPASPSNIGGFTTENGAGTKGKMGEGSKGIEANSGGHGGGSGQAHHVGSGT